MMKRNDIKRSLFGIIILIAFILSSFMRGISVPFEKAYNQGIMILKQHGANQEHTRIDLQERLLKHANLNTDPMTINTKYILPTTEEVIIRYAQQESARYEEQLQQIKNDELFARQLANEIEQPKKQKVTQQEKYTNQTIWQRVKTFLGFNQVSTQEPTLPMPSNATKVKIKIIPVSQQSGFTCGYHTAANLKTIQTRCELDQRINTESFAHDAQENLLIEAEDRFLEDDEVYELAQVLDIKNFMILGSINGAQSGQPVVYLPTTLVNQKEYFKRIKNAQNIEINLATNLNNNHWVAISIVKKNGQATIYYMDSTNNGLPKGSRQEYIVNFLKNNI